MSSNKDFLPSSSPTSSICAIEFEAILFLFMMNCYKSSFQECITIIVLKNRAYEEPAAILFTSATRKNRAFRLSGSGCLGAPLTLPQSLYGRTDVRWRQNQNFSDQRVTKFAYPWCSASSPKNYFSTCELFCVFILITLNTLKFVEIGVHLRRNSSQLIGP